MAEILITGMEMPKDMSNPLHISIFSNGSVWITHEGKTEATAQELPPHGDLFDADAVEAEADRIQAENGCSYRDALFSAFDNADIIVDESK